MQKILIALVTVASVAACVQFPQLDAAVSEDAQNADFPNLVPGKQITDQRVEERLGDTDGEILLARAQRLRQRGEILRRIPTIDEAARVRFARTLDRLGG